MHTRRNITTTYDEAREALKRRKSRTICNNTALVALDSGKARTAAGGALFMASDTLLALEKFAGVHLPAHEGWVMATYTGAQGLLAAE